MKITFIIPAYNEEARIAQCVTSIKHAVERAGCEAEIIVADNNSTDRTSAVVASVAGVRVVNETWKGPNRARQAGFKVATGDLIANIDADGMLPDNWLPNMFAAFERDPKLVGLSGPYLYYDLPFFSNALVYFFQATGYLFNEISRVFGVGAMFLGGNCVMRRSALEKIGGYNTTIDFYGDDVDTAQRLGTVGKVRFTMRIPLYASGRRFKRDGVLRVNAMYVLNYLSKVLFGKSATKKYSDVRIPVAPDKKDV